MIRLLTIRNDISQLACLDAFLKQITEEFKLSESVGMHLKLAVEEVVVNIISYAYSGKEDEKIDLSVVYAPERITVTITDSGFPFDPTSKPEPDISLPLEKRPIGGLGTYLMKHLMTKVTYVRSGNKNVLTMIKEMD